MANRLEYLEMKEKYLALKNELDLQDELEGQGFFGSMRRGIKKRVYSMGDIEVAIDFYREIFKKQKLTPNIIKGKEKVHNDLKYKYFDSLKVIADYESFIKNFPVAGDPPDPILMPCLKNKDKLFKKKYPQKAYKIVFMYPYERAVYYSVKAAVEGKENVAMTSMKASQLIQAYQMLQKNY